MNKCEICSSTENITEYIVEPNKTGENCFLCRYCQDQINETTELNINHWRCLNDSMWSENRSIQVLSYRMLNRLVNEQWALDLLDMLYLDDDTLTWAKSNIEQESLIKHIDSNGNILNSGDTVTLIKDLDVKGASFVAKRGTAVRKISLDPYNEEYIEGRVNGQKIVILTKYVKKSN